QVKPTQSQTVQSNGNKFTQCSRPPYLLRREPIPMDSATTAVFFALPGTGQCKSHHQSPDPLIQDTLAHRDQTPADSGAGKLASPVSVSHKYSIVAVLAVNPAGL